MGGSGGRCRMVDPRNFVLAEPTPEAYFHAVAVLTWGFQASITAQPLGSCGDPCAIKLPASLLSSYPGTPPGVADVTPNSGGVCRAFRALFYFGREISSRANRRIRRDP